jgi:hypothetical protein
MDRTQHSTPADETRWFFYEDAEGRWRWDAVAGDRVIVKCVARFPSRAHAVEDAKRYGYGGANAVA